MELTIDDVRQMALELWLAQREISALQAEVVDLRHRLEQADPQQPGHAVTGG